MTPRLIQRRKQNAASASERLDDNRDAVLLPSRDEVGRENDEKLQGFTDLGGEARCRCRYSGGGAGIWRGAGFLPAIRRRFAHRSAHSALRSPVFGLRFPLCALRSRPWLDDFQTDGEGVSADCSIPPGFSACAKILHIRFRKDLQARTKLHVPFFHPPLKHRRDVSSREHAPQIVQRSGLLQRLPATGIGKKTLCDWNHAEMDFH